MLHLDISWACNFEHSAWACNFEHSETSACRHHIIHAPAAHRMTNSHGVPSQASDPSHRNHRRAHVKCPILPPLAAGHCDLGGLWLVGRTKPRTLQARALPCPLDLGKMPSRVKHVNRRHARHACLHTHTGVLRVSHTQWLHIVPGNLVEGRTPLSRAVTKFHARCGLPHIPVRQQLGQLEHGSVLEAGTGAAGDWRMDRASWGAGVRGMGAEGGC